MSPEAANLCNHFQLDLSCLIDGELEEQSAARAMLHLEDCSCCRDFFEDTRDQVRMHRDMADPDRLFARIAMLTGASGMPSGADLTEEAKGIELVHKLATVFYKLGKAYILAATDPGYRERVFEKVVPVQPTQTRARGFVDGVLGSSGGRDAGGVDWEAARKILNGRLERIESPLEKGRRLLKEALAADPSHEEARLYLAWLHGHEGKQLKAAREYKAVFETALDEANRGHAAIQLGRLHSVEGDYRQAIICWRWITMSGLADRDDRFFVARFNLGMAFVLTGNRERSLSYFRELLDRHPTRVNETAALFARSPKLRAAIDEQSGFGEQLVATCPELFRPLQGESPQTADSEE
jgi:tetratricopeptide (TPR) repeat protein